MGLSYFKTSKVKRGRIGIWIRSVESAGIILNKGESETLVNVIVVDDHPIVREGLKRIIADNIGMAVTGEAGDGYEALRVIRAGPCDLVLLDLAIPQKSGFDVLMQIHSEKPGLPVLILSASSEDQIAMRCIRAGASGYLTKETAVGEIIQAIHKVLRGGKYVSETLGEKLAFNLKSNTDRPHDTLSHREYQVLCMMASGKTLTQVAGDLALSVKTISTYRARILEKLMLENSAALVRYAIKEGLVN